MKFSANYFSEIKIQSLAELDVTRITKQEATDKEPVLSWCNGLLFNYSFSEKNPEESDGIIRFDYFYFAKSEKIESSKWNGHAVEVHDFSGIPLFEEITKKIKETKNAIR
ncbi:hypothetical protein AAA799B03_01097 [Marine Group I thaumarchaeote SCGC AAA799-B03]|uniref:Uncharacterized protein n=1 Tax=Marine Group I thaumarchaeote SCGC AAA799-B03 TaxID=1502289 RepID=A0A087S6L1_9ARCH|nr:hypothetical protein AAA799B03_01097 [Marine Group I thaumarchaeote SCGC AAA799-B03]